MTWYKQYWNGQWWTWNDEPFRVLYERAIASYEPTELQLRIDKQLAREAERKRFQEYLADVERRIEGKMAEFGPSRAWPP